MRLILHRMNVDNVGNRRINARRARLAGKAFFLTYPQCSESKEALLAHLKTLGSVLQAVVSRENHQDGGHHLHAYVKYDKKIDTTNMAFFDFKEHHGNYQTCKNPLACKKYVEKDGDFIQEGIDYKSYQKARLEKKSIVAAQLISRQITVEEAVRTNPELIYQYFSLKKNVDSFLLNTQVVDHYQRDNYWIVGSPGIGKSQWAHRNYPDSYKKAQNKWWDGYKGELSVILDDMDTNTLGHYLKIWGDNYHCTGECKGGTVPLKHTTMIITSNYRISDLWENDKVMAAAIARRFKTFTVKGDYENGYFLEELSEYHKY